MRKIYIYVEGESDKDFLDCYLKYLGKIEKYEISPIKTNSINENLISKMHKHKDNDEQVLIIFDADEDFVKTKDRILKDCQGLITEQELFLFPNNQDKGELETLLLEIAKDKKPCECFKCYIECLGDLKTNVFKKSAMYAYREAMGTERKIKNAKNQEKTKIMQTELERIFDFDSNVLKPLREFIEQAFQRLNSLQ